MSRCTHWSPLLTWLVYVKEADGPEVRGSWMTPWCESSLPPGSRRNSRWRRRPPSIRYRDTTDNRHISGVNVAALLALQYVLRHLLIHVLAILNNSTFFWTDSHNYVMYYHDLIVLLRMFRNNGVLPSLQAVIWIFISFVRRLTLPDDTHWTLA